MGSGKNIDMDCSSSKLKMSMYNSSSADPIFQSGWDPIVSLNQSENFGGSSMVSHTEFHSSSYPQYHSDSSFVELVPKLSSFGSGSFLDMVGSFGLPDSSQIDANTGSPPNYGLNKLGGSELTSANAAHTHEDHQTSDEGPIAASPNGNRRKWNVEESEVPKEHNEKKQKIEETTKRTGKNPKENCNSGDDSKENYIHVRARRGQATNSHSLAERVRREKISERMRLLQELVPGCNKITGKAVMLDEIINYVQSLQQQVEFLSMKLATVNPELNIDLERIISKEILHSRDVNTSTLRFGPGMNFSHPYYPHGSFQGTLPGISNMTQNVLDNELQSFFQIGFDSNSAIDTLGPNAGRLKSEI